MLKLKKNTHREEKYARVEFTWHGSGIWCVFLFAHSILVWLVVLFDVHFFVIWCVVCDVVCSSGRSVYPKQRYIHRVCVRVDAVATHNNDIYWWTLSPAHSDETRPNLSVKKIWNNSNTTRIKRYYCGNYICVRTHIRPSQLLNIYIFIPQNQNNRLCSAIGTFQQHHSKDQQKKRTNFSLLNEYIVVGVEYFRCFFFSVREPTDRFADIAVNEIINIEYCCILAANYIIVIDRFSSSVSLSLSQSPSNPNLTLIHLLVTPVWRVSIVTPLSLSSWPTLRIDCACQKRMIGI